MIIGLARRKKEAKPTRNKIQTGIQPLNVSHLQMPTTKKWEQNDLIVFDNQKTRRSRRISGIFNDFWCVEFYEFLITPQLWNMKQNGLIIASVMELRSEWRSSHKRMQLFAGCLDYRCVNNEILGSEKLISLESGRGFLVFCTNLIREMRLHCEVWFKCVFEFDFLVKNWLNVIFHILGHAHFF